MTLWMKSDHGKDVATQQYVDLKSQMLLHGRVRALKVPLGLRMGWLSGRPSGRPLAVVKPLNRLRPAPPGSCRSERRLGVRDVRAVIAVTRRDAEGRERRLHVCAVLPISGDPNKGEQEEQLRQEGG